MQDTAVEVVKAILVGVDLQVYKDDECEKSLDELARLLDTAGGEVFARLVQAKTTYDPRTCIGSGKVKELAELCKDNDIKLVIFDTELSPSQIKNLEDEIDGVRIVDRSMLILDIFALHATTSEGKLQVELAQLKYTIPRLIGKGTQLSRLGGSVGGIAARGPGESKLETDRRHLKRRMDALGQELEELEKNRLTQRKQREKSGLLKVAIAGYTNAGKSTLLNKLTDAGILAEDKLFATLDPTTRKFGLPSGVGILLTDTVGFIRNLPHHLIKAFKSTLDEVACADIIMIIIDASDNEHKDQLEVTENLLNELGAEGKPLLYVYNKCDLKTESIPFVKIDAQKENVIFISAKTGEGTEDLINRLEELASNGKTDEVFKIPNSEQALLNILYKNSSIQNIDYGEENVTIKATVDAKVKGILKNYIIV